MLNGAQVKDETTPRGILRHREKIPISPLILPMIQIKTEFAVILSES
jgi:hypothetical protein